MTANVDKYVAALDRLEQLGDTVYAHISIVGGQEGGIDSGDKHILDALRAFIGNYQRWYTESCALLRQILPERLSEFQSCYEQDPRRKEITSLTYCIQDLMLGITSGVNASGKPRFAYAGVVFMRFSLQREILRSARARFESSLFDIQHLAQADLFDSEMDAARELHKNGFSRAAGVVSGVVLESHLSVICKDHCLETRKKNPTISDYNDLLKQSEVIDVPTWRMMQRLSDIRNYCAHKKERDATESEVSELLDGVSKIIKTLF